MRAYELLNERYEPGMFVGVKLSPSSIVALADWQQENNIPNPYNPSHMHVTLLYSKDKEFPWEPKQLKLKIDPSTYKLEMFGPEHNTLVLSFDSSELQARHKAGRKEHNLSWDFDSYKPHVTLARDLPKDFNVNEIKIPNFPILLNGEYVEKYSPPDNLKEYTMNDLMMVDSANSGAYISPKGEVFELDKHFAHMETLKDSPYGKELENKIINKFGKEAAYDPYNESVWHSVAQNDGWVKVTWTVYRGREKVVLQIEFRQPAIKAVQALIKWIHRYKDEFDLFRVNTESVPDFNSFVKLLRKYPTITETAGVGTIQPHNTTADVKPGEIQRQAKKWGWDIDKDGNPPLIDTIHKRKKK